MSKLMLIGTLVLCSALLGPTSAWADYEQFPELKPENRCAGIDPASDPYGKGGKESVHCQRLFWDLPAATRPGFRAAGSPFAEDPVPRFPNGLTDRIPPMFVADEVLSDGTPGQDGIFEGYEAEVNPTTGEARARLCADPDTVPWWKPVLKPGSLENEIGTGDPLPDGTVLHSVSDPAQPQQGKLFEVACRRGTRTRFGPWQTGMDANVYDRLGDGVVRFESTERMDRDAARGDIDEETGRREWNTGTEFYNHFASHHGTCWNPETTITSGAVDPGYLCNDPDDPWTASDTGPGGKCEGYQKKADLPDPCYAGDEDVTACDREEAGGQMFRNATQYPGRLYVEFPEGRGVVSLEDQLWSCDHHVVTQLPPGSYGMQHLANYRLQKHGLVNGSDHDIYGAKPTEEIGGAVGEMILQYFTEPFVDPSVKPINVAFEVVQDLATTEYPPFTWNYHTMVWHAPFDLAVGLITIHSHHRSVKGFVEVIPANPVRLESTDADCGGAAGGTPPLNVYNNWFWEDPRICEYWRHPDGPLILRKGEALRTVCYVNNGVTPEAIKHGLVGESLVEVLRSQGAPIPRTPGTMPTSEWQDLLVQSPIGSQFLYGTHPPINYRVVYKCDDHPGITPATVVDNPPVCRPNPAVDEDGDTIDAPYVNDDQCGGKWCNPASVIFANVGEDEMCIPVFMYWRLDSIVKPDGSVDEEVAAKATSGDPDDLNEVGTPGAIQKSPGDIGDCRECKAAGL